MLINDERVYQKQKSFMGIETPAQALSNNWRLSSTRIDPLVYIHFQANLSPKGQKAKRVLVALYNTYLVVRIATIDYEELKDPRNLASRSQIARRFALYNQTLLLQATSIHYFTTPRDPRWFFNFPKLSYSCIIFKNSSSLKI